VTFIRIDVDGAIIDHLAHAAEVQSAPLRVGQSPGVKTDWPALSLAFATSGFQAVILTKAKAAASSNEMEGGLCPTFFVCNDLLGEAPA